MMLMQALAVVGENLDHPAFVDAAVLASAYHALQFSPQRRQAGDALLDLDQA
jgi:hypothetical protein